eukprot:jgi/Antlo1/1321/1003
MSRMCTPSIASTILMMCMCFQTRALCVFLETNVFERNCA